MAEMMDDARLASFVGRMWDDEIVPTLVDYIRIPNKSPAFDPDWVAHGHMEKAVTLFEDDTLTAPPPLPPAPDTAPEPLSPAARVPNDPRPSPCQSGRIRSMQ